VADRPGLAGILLTHAHIGHYTGLVYLGREGMNARAVPVYAMPRMTEFLLTNQPWKQLVTLGNIELRPLHAGRASILSKQVSVTPLSVPHRAEISETVGFRIEFPKRSLLYVPDIDRWDDGNLDLIDLISRVDTAYLDGTFFSDAELPGRDLAEIPHPRIAEYLLRFSNRPDLERAKIRFVHLNHSNPVLHPTSDAAKQVAQAGMHVAHDGEQIAGD
jgi:pyrroloquinoline quinone biosynthesis protein B